MATVYAKEDSSSQPLSGASNRLHSRRSHYAAGQAHWNAYRSLIRILLTRAIVPGEEMTIVAVTASDVLWGAVLQASHGMQYSSAGSDVFDDFLTKGGVSTRAACVARIAALVAFTTTAGLGPSGALGV
jgi:hypothetical protein